VVALRAFGQIVEPWSGTRLPWRELAFLGGGSDHRGFRVDGAGPYDCLCEQAGDTTTLRYLPRGGRFKVGASGEVRYVLGWGVSAVPFVDAGLLASTLRDLGEDDLRLAGGVGLRYDTAAGPVRLDVGLRPLYPEDRPETAGTRFVGCDAAFDRVPRAFDLVSQFARTAAVRRGDGVYDFPSAERKVALNLFFSIDQAF
jgi:outer membrane protein assembly factor BamA